MQLHQLKSKTVRKSQKRVGRGGKRGTFSGHGTKGQKGRAGSSVKPGFRGGDNRLWQLFPKARGASKKSGKSGNDRRHTKHRFFSMHRAKPVVVRLDTFNKFSGDISPEMLVKAGLIENAKHGVKVLGGGEVKNKISLKGFKVSNSAKSKIEKAGGTIE